MDIKKIITEAVSDMNIPESNNDIAVSDDETAFSDTLLRMSLPSAISAGLGAMNLRKVESGEIYEVDWEEMTDKLGAVAKKAGHHVAKKVSDMSTDVGDFGHDVIHGVKKVAKRAAEDVADKFQGKGPISGLLKAGKRKLEDTGDGAKSSVYSALKASNRWDRDNLEKLGIDSLAKTDQYKLDKFSKLYRD